jgi:hypothetical protein
MTHRTLLRIATSLLFLIAVTGTANAADAKKPGPDATIKLVSKSVAAGAGIAWGSGKVHYKGKYYDIDVDGLTVGSVGVSSITAVGRVYNLKKLEDLDGQYTAAVAGATVGGGTGGLAMKNQNGVEVRFTATTRGLSFTAGVSGVKIALKH